MDYSTRILCSNVELNIDVSTLWRTYGSLREGCGQPLSIFWIEGQSHCKDDGIISIALQQIDRGYHANAPDMETVLLPQLQQDQFWHLPVRAAVNRVSRLFPVVAKELVLGRATCCFYPMDGSSEHVSVVLCCNMITFAINISIMDSRHQLCLQPTDLLRNLSGTGSGWAWREPQMGCVIHIGGNQFSLVYADDDAAFSSHRVCGMWISGVKNLHHPFVWAACVHFLHGAKNLATYHNTYILLLYPGNGKPVDSCSWYPTEDGSSATFTHLGCCEQLTLTKHMQGSIKLLLQKDKYGEASLAFQTALRQFCWPLPQSQPQPLGVLQTAMPMTPHTARTAEDDRPRQAAPRPHQQILKIRRPSVPDISMFYAPSSASSRRWQNKQESLWPDDTCDITGSFQKTASKENHPPNRAAISKASASGCRSVHSDPPHLPIGLQARDLAAEQDSTDHRVMAWLSQQKLVDKGDSLMQTNGEHLQDVVAQSDGMPLVGASLSRMGMMEEHRAVRRTSSEGAASARSGMVDTTVSNNNLCPIQAKRTTSPPKPTNPWMLGQLHHHHTSSVPGRGSTNTNGSSSANSGCSSVTLSKSHFSFPAGASSRRLSSQSSTGSHVSHMTTSSMHHQDTAPSGNRHECSGAAAHLNSANTSTQPEAPWSSCQRHGLCGGFHGSKRLDQLHVNDEQAAGTPQHGHLAQIDGYGQHVSPTAHQHVHRHHPAISSLSRQMSQHSTHPLMSGCPQQQTSPDRETIASQSSIGTIAGPPGSSVSQQITHWDERLLDSLSSPASSVSLRHEPGLQERVALLCQQLDGPSPRPVGDVQAYQAESSSGIDIPHLSTSSCPPSAELSPLPFHTTDKRLLSMPSDQKQEQDIQLERSMQVRLLQEKYLPQSGSKRNSSVGFQVLSTLPEKEKFASLNLPINLSSIKDADMTVDTRHWLKKLCQPQNI